MGSNRLTVYDVVLVLILVFFSSFTFFSNSVRLLNYELLRGLPNQGYVSDEVWYVSASRNLLTQVFGTQLPTSYGTVCFKSFSERRSYEGLGSVIYVYEEIPCLYVSDVGVFHDASSVIRGWMMPDRPNITDYLNLEHVPSAKYLIALSIIAFGDNPLSWRTPSVIAGSLLIVVVYLVVLKLTKNWLLAFITSVVLVLDPLVKSMSSIAMLDVWVALFSTLSLYLILSNRLDLALITVAIGSTFKVTVLLNLIPVAIHLLSSKGLRGVVKKLSMTAYLVFLTIVLFFAVSLLLSYPFVTAFGIDGYLRIAYYVLVNSLRTGCGQSTCSTPFEWFFGSRSFVLYDSPVITASMNVCVSLAVLALMLFELPMIDSSDTLQFLIGSWSGYVLLYVLGREAQYSFYSTHFVGFAYVFLATTLYWYVLIGSYRTTIYRWFDVFEKILGLVKRVLYVILRPQ